ncbi:MAG TPA: SRPBCC domain-containing protein [Bryobacteraceae bacterium]|nr:SRPBCC domain-containing protein [Bryobacteraceae bacterium]
MLEQKNKLEPIVRAVDVDCDREEAFRIFTERFAKWWPLASYSIHKERAKDCEMQPGVGGRIFERTKDGKTHDWGFVIAWDPPRRLVFTWSPGRKPDVGETVEVEFRVVAVGTRITVTHRGWERSGAQASIQRDEIGSQWTSILWICAEEMMASALCHA